MLEAAVPAPALSSNVMKSLPTLRRLSPWRAVEKQRCATKWPGGWASIGRTLGSLSKIDGGPLCGEPVFDDPALRRVLANAFVDFPQPIEDLALPTLVTALAKALSRHCTCTTSSNARLPESPR